MTDTNNYDDIYNIVEPILTNINRPKPLSYDGIVELWTLVDIPMDLTKSVIKLIKRIYVPFNESVKNYRDSDNFDILLEKFEDDDFTAFIYEKIINDPVNYYSNDTYGFLNLEFKADNLLYYFMICHLVVLKEYLLIHNISDNKLVNILNCAYLYDSRTSENLYKSQLSKLSDFLMNVIFSLYDAQFYMADDYLITSKYKKYDEVIKKALIDVNMTKKAKELFLIFTNKQVYLKQFRDSNRKDAGLPPLIKSYTKYINTNIEKIINNLITTNKISELDVIEAIVFNGEDIFSD